MASRLTFAWLSTVVWRAQTVVRRKKIVKSNWESSLETLLAKVKLDLGSWHRPMIILLSFYKAELFTKLAIAT